MSGSFFKQDSIEADYRKQGYVLVPLLTAPRIEELKALMRSLFFSYDNNTLRNRCNYSSSLFEPDAAKRITLFEDVSRILKPVLQEWVRDFDIIMVNYWNKMEQEGAVEIHQNWAHTEEPGNFTLTVWIPLQDVDRQNGTMEVVPRSHHKFEPVRGINFGNPYLEIGDKIIANDLVALPMKTGEAVFFDDGLLHYTGPNKTGEAREAVQLVIKPKSAPARFYYRHTDRTGQNVEVFDAAHPFYSMMQVVPGKTGRPENAKSLGFTGYKNQVIPYCFFKNALQSDRAYSFGNYLQEALTNTLSLIRDKQLSPGEFQTLELYPTIAPGKWIEGPSSPFITASVLLSLLDIEDATAKEIKHKGAGFIKTMEEDRLWRFWKNGTSENSVPPDADDTALSSYALQRVSNINIENKRLFGANRNAAGLFYTWFLPRLSFLKFPGKLLSMLKDTGATKGTIEKGFLDKEDVEVAVLANVLLYLSESETTRLSIQYIIDTLKGGGDHPKHFYANDIFIWYHVGRAHHYSVPGLGALADTFATFYKQQAEAIDLKTDLPLGIVLYNTSCYFNQGINASKFLRKILDAADSGCDYPYPYFTSKNRVYNAGSAALTLSWYAELLQNALKVHS